MRSSVRLHTAKLVICAMIGALYLIARPDQISATQRDVLAAGLRFRATYLEPAETGRPMRAIRDVNPSVSRIDAWISSVGAAVALADVSGSGRPADICLVDPRNDSVTISPAPETGDRFRAFALATPTDGYDPASIAPMGCLPLDLNEDGRMDLLVYYWGRTPVAFLRNDSPALSPAAFTSVEIVGTREIWNTNAAIASDVDGDGHPDLVFGNYFRTGDRVLDPRDKAGISMQHSMSRADNAGPSRLLLWTGATPGAVSYRDASKAFPAGAATGWTLAIAARDLDDDFLMTAGPDAQPYRGLPEVYFANDFGPDHLLLNRSRPGHPRFTLATSRRSFTDPASKVLGRDSFKGMGADFGDVVGDGHPALAVSNISSPYALLESHFLFVNTGDAQSWGSGIAPYRDQSGPRGMWTSGWSWDIKFADLLNTGRPAILQAVGFVKGKRSRWPELQELAMGNDEGLRHPGFWPRFSTGDELSGNDHDRLFLPVGGKFQDVWPSLGLDDRTVSRGIATGDVFGDGRLSVAIARQWSPSLFLRNVSGDVGRAIVVDLRVPGAVAGTRPALGAEARVTLSDGRVVTSVVDGGSGHSGKRAPEIHLGLGQGPRDETFDVEFRWRDAAGFHAKTVPLKPGRSAITLGLAEPAHVAAPSESNHEP
jgi:enediyne biosynthesis protein E4